VEVLLVNCLFALEEKTMRMLQLNTTKWNALQLASIDGELEGNRDICYPHRGNREPSHMGAMILLFLVPGLINRHQMMNQTIASYPMINSCLTREKQVQTFFCYVLKIVLRGSLKRELLWRSQESTLAIPHFDMYTSKTD
jgi:hypothetical protein